MVVKAGSDSRAIRDTVGQYVSGVEVNRSHGQELDLMLPLTQVATFPGEYFKLTIVANEHFVESIKDTRSVSCFPYSRSQILQCIN